MVFKWLWSCDFGFNVGFCVQVRSWRWCIMMSRSWRTITWLWPSSSSRRKTVISSWISHGNSAKLFVKWPSIWWVSKLPSILILNISYIQIFFSTLCITEQLFAHIEIIFLTWGIFNQNWNPGNKWFGILILVDSLVLNKMLRWFKKLIS